MAEIRNLQRPGRAAQKRRGFALLFVLAFAAVVIVFTATIGSEATFNMRLASTRGQTDRAYYAANTGTQLILSLLREPPFLDPNHDGKMDGETEAWLATDATMRANLNRSQSQAYAKVYHNIKGFPHASPDVPESDVKIAPDNFYIISLGVVNGQYEDGELVGGMRYEQATMGATLAPQFPLLPHAAFSYDQMAINGKIDYFDSRDAAFTPSTDSSRAEASIATAKLAAADMQISATAKILGNVFLGKGSGDLAALAASIPDVNVLDRPSVVNPAGEGGAPQFGVAGSGEPAYPASRDTAIVAGRIDSLPETKDAFEPDKDPNSFEHTFPANYAAGSDLVLKEGKRYKYTGNLNISGSRRISVEDTNSDGTVEDAILVVDGDIDFNGANNINSGNPPKRLKIFSLDGVNFRMTNSTAYCLVAGNKLDVAIDGGSELWGAVLGNKVMLANNGEIHYDVALRDPNIVAGVYGFRIGNSTITAGDSGFSLANLASPRGVADPTTTGTAATGTSGTGSTTTGTGTVGGGGCGCGCGCGSMLMAQEQKV